MRICSSASTASKRFHEDFAPGDASRILAIAKAEAARLAGSRPAPEPELAQAGEDAGAALERKR